MCTLFACFYYSWLIRAHCTWWWTVLSWDTCFLSNPLDGTFLSAEGKLSRAPIDMHRVHHWVLHTPRVPLVQLCAKRAGVFFNSCVCREIFSLTQNYSNVSPKSAQQAFFFLSFFPSHGTGQTLRFVYQRGPVAEHNEEKVDLKCNSIRQAVNSFSAALKLRATQGFILFAFTFGFGGLWNDLVNISCVCIQPTQEWFEHFWMNSTIMSDFTVGEPALLKCSMKWR